MSQNEMILQHMQEHGSITAADAIELYGCLRLAARIADLREMGHTISAKMERGKNRYDKSTQYARYILED